MPYENATSASTPSLLAEEAFVEVSGARVHYLHAGAGHPMLLIHGLVGSSENWRSNLEALAAHASVYAIDLVNMGKSQRVDGVDAGLRATADRIIAVMDALGLARADIVAHSHGGAVALMLAARHPRRVSRLILFAPANPYSNASDTMVRLYSTPWGAFALRMLPYLPAAIQRRALGDMYGGPQNVVDASLRELSQGLRQPGTLRHVLAIVRSWFVEMHRLRRALHRIGRIPTLLVWGDRDFTVSLRSGMRLHRKLRGSKLVVIPGGHSVFEESPDAVNRIVTDWLGQTSSAGPRRSALAARTRQRAALRAVAAKPSAAASLHRLPSES